MKKLNCDYLFREREVLLAEIEFERLEAIAKALIVEKKKADLERVESLIKELTCKVK